MTCYHPLTAYELLNETTERGKKKLVFKTEDVGGKPSRELSVPCGQCIGCRLRRSRDWATRCTHEAQQRESLGQGNCFITLTFSKEYLPDDLSVDIRDVQLFMKRLRQFHERKRYNNGTRCYEDRVVGGAPNKIGFFACGEYGEECKKCGMPRRLCPCRKFKKTVGRAHYHLCLFGFEFEDKEHWKRKDGYDWYTSVSLAKLWPYGWHICGALSWQSAAYCARYVTKKVNGDPQESHYRKINKGTGEVLQLVPEFATMSRSPAIGKSWIEAFHRDVYPRQNLTVEGRRVEAPKYYDRMGEDLQPKAVEVAKQRRLQEANKHRADSTLRRLRDRKTVKMAQFGKLIRSLENDAGMLCDL